MILSINQPAYLPWPGYFERIQLADLHVELDHVQFEKNSFVNRNRLRSPDGWCWLTVPIKTRSRFGQLPSNEGETSEDGRGRRKHWNTLQNFYRKALFFGEYAAFFEALWQKPWPKVIDLLRESNSYLMNVLGITTPVVISSERSWSCAKSELVLEICKNHGATTYLSGEMGRDYLDLPAFEQAGIEVRFHAFTPFEYRQCFQGFEGGLSVLDALMNMGQDVSNHMRTCIRSLPTQ